METDTGINIDEVLRRWGLSDTANFVSSATTPSSSNTASNADSENPFLDSPTKGIIKLIPDAGDPVTFLAEDVTVSKTLPLSTQQDQSGQSQSYDTTSDSSGNGSSGTQQAAQLTIQCKITITPRDMSEDDFRTKRANYLFDFEDKTFTVVSDMFRKAMEMQFTSLQYVIPAGERAAQYQVEMTQVSETKDDRSTTDSTAEPTDFFANGATDEEAYQAYQNSLLGANSTTNSTSG